MACLYTLMNEVHSSLVRNRSVMNLATETGVIGSYQDDVGAETNGVGKWPVWLRILIIVGLSSGLWGLIIAGITALL